MESCETYISEEEHLTGDKEKQFYKFTDKALRLGFASVKKKILEIIHAMLKIHEDKYLPKTVTDNSNKIRVVCTEMLSNISMYEKEDSEFMICVDVKKDIFFIVFYIEGKDFDGEKIKKRCEELNRMSKEELGQSEGLGFYTMFKNSDIHKIQKNKNKDFNWRIEFGFVYNRTMRGGK